MTSGSARRLRIFFLGGSLRTSSQRAGSLQLHRRGVQFLSRHPDKRRFQEQARGGLAATDEGGILQASCGDPKPRPGTPQMIQSQEGLEKRVRTSMGPHGLGDSEPSPSVCRQKGRW